MVSGAQRGTETSRSRMCRKSHWLSQKIQHKSFTKKIHSPAALNNPNKSSVGLYRKQRETGRVSFSCHVPIHILPTKKGLIHVNCNKLLQRAPFKLIYYSTTGKKRLMSHLILTVITETGLFHISAGRLYKMKCASIHKKKHDTIKYFAQYS